MSGQTVAGVDWAGDTKFVVVMNGNGIDWHLQSDLESFWYSNTEYDRISIDISICLPHNEETLAKREKLDSIARTVIGKSSSVFPVPP